MVAAYEFIHNFMLDSCSFDTNDPREQQACTKIFEWEEKGIVVPIVPHSVMKEIDHPNTPSWKKKKAHELVSTVDLGLTQEKNKKLQALKEIITDNDALHVLIAQDSAAYFVTADNRYIVKKQEIEQILLGIKICKPSEFVRIVENDNKQWQKSMEWRKQQDLI